MQTSYVQTARFYESFPVQIRSELNHRLKRIVSVRCAVDQGRALPAASRRLGKASRSSPSPPAVSKKPAAASRWSRVSILEFPRLDVWLEFSQALLSAHKVRGSHCFRIPKWLLGTSGWPWLRPLVGPGSRAIPRTPRPRTCSLHR